MSVATSSARPAASHPTLLDDIRTYFASDARRTIQTVLGLIWLLDGCLQLQSFMYSKGFPQMLTGMAMAGQPHWLVSSIDWGARFAGGDLGLWNSLFALTQVAIGAGILYRPTVKAALAASFGWAFVVWWFGEAFGMLFMNMANPLTGAPGAVVLYALIGLIVWPNDRRGGLLGVRGARIAWAALWVGMGWLWLLAPNSSANATRDAIEAAPSGMSWLDTVLRHAADLTQGNGLLIAIVLAAASVAIGLAVGFDWHPRAFLWLSVYLSAAYWVVGQGFGGIATGSATDPNAGLLFIVLAAALYTLLPQPAPRVSHVRKALPRPPVWVFLACTFALGAGGGAAIAIVRSSSSPSAVAFHEASTTPGVSWAAGKRLAPGFSLRDQSGRPISLRQFRGRAVILTFIDPVCRHLCPLEAKTLDRVAASFPPAQRPAIVAVSVNRWANARKNLLLDESKWRLPSDWQWAVGRPTALARVWKHYAIGVSAQTKTIAGITVHRITHTEAAYVIDPQGYERALFVYPFRPQDVEHTLRSLGRA